MLKCQFFKEVFLLKYFKLDGLEDSAGETNFVQRHCPRLITSSAFGQFWWTWQRFRSRHIKRGVWLLGVFFSPPHTCGKAWKDFLPLSKPNRGVGRMNNNSFVEQEGAVTTSGECLQRGVCQGLCDGHKVQQKVHPSRLGPRDKKN
jgi:hypothetical protein